MFKENVRWLFKEWRWFDGVGIGLILGIAMIGVFAGGVAATNATIRAIARPAVGSELTTNDSGWFTIAEFASSGGAATDLAVGERTYATIIAAIAADAGNDGQIVVFDLPYGANAVRFRNIGLAAAGDHVYQLYSSAKFGAADSAFVKRGTLTFKTGSQASTVTGFEFADLLTVTNTSASSASWTVANPGDGTELVAEAFIDMQGDDTLVIVPTTLDDNSKLLGKYY